GAGGAGAEGGAGGAGAEGGAGGAGAEGGAGGAGAEGGAGGAGAEGGAGGAGGAGGVIVEECFDICGDLQVACENQPFAQEFLETCVEDCGSADEADRRRVIQCFADYVVEGECTPETVSQCLDGECDCPAVEMPVCGEDGETYGNACLARCEGVRVASRGRCGAEACQDGFIRTPRGDCQPVCMSDDQCDGGQACNADELCLSNPRCVEGEPCDDACYGFCVPDQPVEPVDCNFACEVILECNVVPDGANGDIDECVRGCEADDDNARVFACLQNNLANQVCDVEGFIECMEGGVVPPPPGACAEACATIEACGGIDGQGIDDQCIEGCLADDERDVGIRCINANLADGVCDFEAFQDCVANGGGGPGPGPNPADPVCVEACNLGVECNAFPRDEVFQCIQFCSGAPELRDALSACSDIHLADGMCDNEGMNMCMEEAGGRDNPGPGGEPNPGGDNPACIELCGYGLACGQIAADQVELCLAGCNEEPAGIDAVVECGRQHLANGRCDNEAMQMCVGGR
ncbi:MAG: Kazal-type serine protease inhibitor family protein, partial [Bradymonadia bacterium]